MKTVRILLLLALCGAANMSQAMWRCVGKAIATRVAAARSFKSMQTFKTGFTSPYKFMPALNAGLLNRFKNNQARTGIIFGSGLGITAIINEYNHHQTSYANPFANKDGIITIKDLAGNINVEGWNNDAIEIKARKEANSQAAMNDTQIKIGGTRTTAEIDTVWQGQYSFDHPPAIVSGSNSAPKFNGKPAALMHYDVKAPRHSKLVVRNIAGSILLKNIFGSVDARTTSGNIDTYNCSNIKAESVGGNINLDGSHGTAQADTVGGNILITGSAGRTLRTATGTSVGGNVSIADADDAHAKSIGGNVTITGAQTGKASTVGGIASLNGCRGKSVELMGHSPLGF